MGDTVKETGVSKFCNPFNPSTSFAKSTTMASKKYIKIIFKLFVSYSPRQLYS